MQKQLYAVWLNGHSSHYEITSELSKLNRFDGDQRDLGKHSVAIKTNYYDGASYKVVDSRDGRMPEQNGFYIYYDIPTPVIVGGQRAVAKDFMMKASFHNAEISYVRVKDTNLGFGTPLDVVLNRGDKSLPKQDIRFNADGFLRLSLGETPVYGGLSFQIGVSVKDKSNGVSISAVGVDFLV